MTTVSVHDAKAHFSALLHQVEEKKEPVLISRYGKVIAQLVPTDVRKRTVVNAALSKIKVNCDLTEPTLDEWNEA
ncbi:MAG: type II toxin-antitoxin system prevent-host-death family antitoxin [Pontiella sp.]